MDLWHVCKERLLSAGAPLEIQLERESCTSSFFSVCVPNSAKMEAMYSYCEQTSLHGWYYIAKDKKAWKIVWTIVVLASVAVASLFITKASQDFTKSTVVTTIHSTTVPLSEVYFPAVTVCNINQVSAALTFDFLRLTVLFSKSKWRPKTYFGTILIWSKVLFWSRTFKIGPMLDQHCPKFDPVWSKLVQNWSEFGLSF